MFKYSIIVLSTLVLVGCGSSSPSDNSKKSQMTDAQKLAYAVANQQKILNSTDKNYKSSRSVIPCGIGGNMTVPFSEQDMKNPNFQYDQVSMDISFDNCKEDTEVLNGRMKMKFNQYNEMTKVSFPDGFSITSKDLSGSIDAGGTIDIAYEGEWEIETINLEMILDGITHGGEDLVYKSKELANGNYIEYPVSGKEKIGNSSYFTVDPTYDASTTPFTTDINEDLLKGGLFKYIDDKNHTVELEVTEKNKITVKVDEDGNGSFEGDEISTIDI